MEDMTKEQRLALLRQARLALAPSVERLDPAGGAAAAAVALATAFVEVDRRIGEIEAEVDMEDDPDGVNEPYSIALRLNRAEWMHLASVNMENLKTMFIEMRVEGPHGNRVAKLRLEHAEEIHQWFSRWLAWHEGQS